MESVKSLPPIGSLQPFLQLLDQVEGFLVQGRLYCPNCKLENKFYVSPVHVTGNKFYMNAADVEKMRRAKDAFTVGSNIATIPWNTVENNPERLEGSFFKFSCATCMTWARALIQKSGEQYLLMVFFQSQSSIATKNTPDNVEYYLKQAYLSNSVKAYSATFGMYRTALDIILQNNGYNDRMLGEKLQSLEKDIQNSSAPPWASKIDTQYLKYIKQLGDSSLHSQNGDISGELKIDDNDVLTVEIAFRELLDKVYEEEGREKRKLNRLEQINKKKKDKK